MANKNRTMSREQQETENRYIKKRYYVYLKKIYKSYFISKIKNMNLLKSKNKIK